MEFEWDESKESENIEKHGLNFSEAAECFFDPQGFVLKDLKHSKQESRYYLVGKHSSGRILTVWYTKRAGKIRIIGCAEWRKFREMYRERTKAK